ncbi:hypothetical protein [Thalassotalea profundi]|uniref:Secreted protein n=1 Tax=Thalassotalea profundi TaxID=2036687 RepID=A0ABQ3J2G3_9GAMM|nr:hypothetical protein [Thalassotalea profundi]GHF01631.1 hypothetical protein GCM10011501_33950 [Thalassotalea profundi]
MNAIRIVIILCLFSLNSFAEGSCTADINKYGHPSYCYCGEEYIYHDNSGACEPIEKPNKNQQIRILIEESLALIHQIQTYENISLKTPLIIKLERKLTTLTLAMDELIFLNKNQPNKLALLQRELEASLTQISKTKINDSENNKEIIKQIYSTLKTLKNSKALEHASKQITPL